MDNFGIYGKIVKFWLSCDSRGAVVARRSYMWSLHQYGIICNANVVGSTPTGSMCFFWFC